MRGADRGMHPSVMCASTFREKEFDMLSRAESIEEMIKLKTKLNFGGRRTSSSFITNALNNVHLSNGLETQQSLTQDTRDSAGPRRNDSLTIDVPLHASQELQCTSEFATPVEQQFHIDYDVSMHPEIEESKSPAGSPIRISKRPRRVAGLEVEQEVTSQVSQSSQRSLGEPSTSSKTTSGCTAQHLPPMPPRNGLSRFARPKSPTCFKNPFLQNGDQNGPIMFEARVPRVRPQYSRLTWDFKIGKEIGSGNFSRVYTAVNRLDGQSYAIKRTKRPISDDVDRNRWLQEVQALAAVQAHPNIIAYYSAWQEPDMNGDHLYIQLELCKESLSTVFRRMKTGMSEIDLIMVMRQVAAALLHIHSRGLVHLDVKPDNIYIARDGNYKLGDFGLSTLKHGHWRVVEGDARYCSQELLNNKYNHLEKADVFALGATLYQLATGMVLPSGGSLYHRIRQGKLALLPSFSENFQKMLKALMHEDPSQRPTAEAILRSSLLTRGTLPVVQVSDT